MRLLAKAPHGGCLQRERRCQTQSYDRSGTEHVPNDKHPRRHKNDPEVPATRNDGAASVVAAYRQGMYPAQAGTSDASSRPATSGGIPGVMASEQQHHSSNPAPALYEQSSEAVYQDSRPAPFTHQSAAQPAGAEDEHISHGTLMLDKEGRSKYLGPTAGSEWLKDVGRALAMAFS